MESTRNRLIEILEQHQDEYISGQELSNTLNISRTAVWKHMKELEKDGYSFEAVPRKGYRVTKHSKKLSSNTLHWGLQTKWLGRQIHHKKSIPSTQTLANQLASEGTKHGTVVIADEQTAGRGRMSRTWFSMKDQGVWMSMVLRPEILPIQAPQITLLAATVLAQVLEDFCKVNVAIKWPNDILINGKKVAGILTEMQAEQDQVQFIVLGIGINVNQTLEMFPKELHDKATSLQIETNDRWDRIEIIQHLLLNFENRYEHYLTSGFSAIKNKWEKYGYKIGEQVDISTPRKQWKAIILGIEVDGALIVKNEDGSMETLYSAEIDW